MKDKCKLGDDHINQSLKQIDSSTWLIGNLILSRSSISPSLAIWHDPIDNSHYTLVDAPTPRPPTTSPPQSPFMKLVHEAGDGSAVWAIGSSAICKVRYIVDGVTAEATTLGFVREQRPIGFDVPEVIYHTTINDRSYLFLTRLPGRTLDKAWPSLSEEWRMHYVHAVVAACKEMAQWTASALGGVDGQHVPEYYLQAKGAEDFAGIKDTCAAIGMDCRRFVFYHADLGPANIVVEDEPMSGRIGIIDFEIAGYLPRGWIRTKFRLSSGMDLTDSDEPTLWRSNVQMALGAQGFEEHVEGWLRWSGM